MSEILPVGIFYSEIRGERNSNNKNKERRVLFSSDCVFIKFSSFFFVVQNFFLFIIERLITQNLNYELNKF